MPNITRDVFFEEVKKLFPHADRELIEHWIDYKHYSIIIPFTWSYGELSEKHCSPTDREQIKKINEMFIELRERRHTWICVRKDWFRIGYYSIHKTTYQNGKMVYDCVLDYFKDKKRAYQFKRAYKAGKVKGLYGGV